MTRKNWHFLWYGGIFILLVVGLALMKVKKVICYTDQQETQVDCEYLDNFVGKSFFFTDFTHHTLWEDFSTAESETTTYYLDKVNKELPGTLVIYLTSRPPLYRVNLGESSFLVTEKGEKKLDMGDLDLPEVIIGNEWPDSVTLEEGVSLPTHEYIKKIVTAFHDDSLPLEKLELENTSQVKVYTGATYPFLLEKSASPEEDVERIALIVNDLDVTQFEQPVKEIDLRFEYPVVRVYE